MRDLEWLKRKASHYDLVAEFVNGHTLKLYSPKFNFDSWMIVESGEEFELWHQSRRFNIRNITYHLQKSVPKHKKIWMLQRIKSHNKFKAFDNRRENIVDRLLREDENRRKNRCLSA